MQKHGKPIYLHEAIMVGERKEATMYVGKGNSEKANAALVTERIRIDLIAM